VEDKKINANKRESSICISNASELSINQAQGKGLPGKDEMDDV
jgi:hypothetical protein